MAYGRQWPDDFYLQIQFFSHLTDNAMLRPFAPVDLSAGKLPFERQIHALASLDGEDLFILLYNRAGNPHGFSRHVLLFHNIEHGSFYGARFPRYLCDNLSISRQRDLANRNRFQGSTNFRAIRRQTSFRFLKKSDTSHQSLIRA